MSDLITVASNSRQGADRVLAELNWLQREYLADLADAVVVVRRPDGGVDLKQSVDMIGAGATRGGLSGAIRSMPIGSAAA